MKSPSASVVVGGAAGSAVLMLEVKTTARITGKATDTDSQARARLQFRLLLLLPKTLDDNDDDDDDEQCCG